MYLFISLGRLIVAVKREAPCTVAVYDLWSGKLKKVSEHPVSVYVSCVNECCERRTTGNGENKTGGVLLRSLSAFN